MEVDRICCLVGILEEGVGAARAGAAGGKGPARLELRPTFGGRSNCTLL